MSESPLATRLAQQIADHLQLKGFARGDRISQRELAELFRVSRTPIRGALKVLSSCGVVSIEHPGRYHVEDTTAQVRGSDLPADDSTYRQIADDRLNGTIPQRITEKELARRYELTPARLSALLRRISNEGWIERLPGHGWEFIPMMTSLQSYGDSYRFRLLIEPAALLEPRWTLDRPAIEARLKEQTWLVDGAIWDLPSSRLFDLNSGMHETIMECSQNLFMIDSLRRVDRLRRLVDYRQMLARELSRQKSIEHIQLLELILAGKNVEASEHLHQHLAETGVLKTARTESWSSQAEVGGP